jgi:hypothetical protein
MCLERIFTHFNGRHIHLLISIVFLFLKYERTLTISPCCLCICMFVCRSVWYIAAGPRQDNHCWLWVPPDSWPQFTSVRVLHHFHSVSMYSSSCLHFVVFVFLCSRCRIQGSWRLFLPSTCCSLASFTTDAHSFVLLALYFNPELSTCLLCSIHYLREATSPSVSDVDRCGILIKLLHYIFNILSICIRVWEIQTHLTQKFLFHNVTCVECDVPWFVEQMGFTSWLTV